MKLILKEHVKTLGNVGDVVNVSVGYARNFLIPKKLAVIADEQNKKFVEDQKRRLLKKINGQRDQATVIKKQIDGLSIELVKRVGGNGKLFGAVTGNELVNELRSKSIEIERRWINMDAPIKELGDFDITVKIFADVEASFKLKVSVDPKQIDELKKKSELRKQAQKEKDEMEKRMQEERERSALKLGEEEGEESSSAASVTPVAKVVKVEAAAAATENKAEKKGGKEKSKKQK
ncbi:MAG: 50S ribosomal protein L9 [Oligoflexia bacterium]|nr:50S ribosomal protein L9 [Oligoflexia bacterium]